MLFLHVPTTRNHHNYIVHKNNHQCFWSRRARPGHGSQRSWKPGSPVAAPPRLPALARGGWVGGWGERLKMCAMLWPTYNQPNSSDGLQPTSNGLQPTSNGLQPRSNGLQPNSDGLPKNCMILHEGFRYSSLSGIFCRLHSLVFCTSAVI